jgi:hypothetical protein
LNFIAPDPTLIRRSECGSYLIEKVRLEDTVVFDEHGKPTLVPVYRYVLWEYYRTQWSFETATEAADEARSLEDQAIQAWARLKAGSQPPPASACATPESAPHPPGGGTE